MTLSKASEDIIQEQIAENQQSILPLSGVRVIEVATHVFVPIAAGILSEWGADVVKVEHPKTGDPYRGLVTAGVRRLPNGALPSFHAANRGKRSVGLDLKAPEGRRILSRLLGSADVFLTNLRPEARRHLRIEVDDIRAENPSIIYARGSAFGARGPDAGRGGYDSGAYWARAGIQYTMTGSEMMWPAHSRPAFGDVMGGLNLAGAITTAMYRRLATGQPSVVDVSLLATGMWQLQVDLMSASLDPDIQRVPASRYESWNPLMLPYRTADSRYILLQMLSPDRYWPDLCKAIGQPDMATDPRFVDMEARRRNARSCIEWLDNTFGQRDFNSWREALAEFPGEWTAVVSPTEVLTDAQVGSNDLIVNVDVGGTVPMQMVAAPAQFDQQPAQSRRGPEHGEHTEDVLLEMGLSWEDIAELKASEVII